MSIGLKATLTELKTALAIPVTNQDGNNDTMWVAIYNNQPERERDGSGYNYKKPAIFIEPILADGLPIGGGATSYELKFKLMLVHEHYNTEGTLDEDLIVFDIKDNIHRALNGLKLANCAPLSQTGRIIDTNHDNLYMAVLEYSTHFVDLTSTLYDELDETLSEQTIEDPILELVENIYTGVLPDDGDGGSTQTIGGSIISGYGVGPTIWYQGSGVPSNGLGNNGDYYLDSSDGFVYYKQSGLWSYLMTLGTGGGGASWTDVTVTDADFSAENDTRYLLAGGVLTANRVVDMSSITTQCMFLIGEDADVHYLTFTGATVYRKGGSESFTQIDGLWATTIESIEGKLIQTA